jgi:hypothetical protein
VAKAQELAGDRIVECQPFLPADPLGLALQEGRDSRRHPRRSG